MRWAGHIWKAFLGFAIALQFLDVPLPAFLGWTTDLDSWLYSHVQSPMLLALLVALVLGTWIIPDAHAYFQPEPELAEHHAAHAGVLVPDTTVREIFEYLLVQSKWAIGQDKYQDKLVDKIAVMLRDAAAQSRVAVFGRSQRDKAGSLRAPVAERIAPTYWANAEFDPTTCYWQNKLGAANTRAVGAASVQDGVPLYEDVQLVKAQIAALWPAASWLALRRDKTRSERL